MRDDGEPPTLADPPEPVPIVEDRALPDGTPVRVYAHGGSGPAPCLVYFFGGGFVLGSLDTIDPTCRRLANAAGCTVVSVGYTRAPEHPFPAAVEAPATPRRDGSRATRASSASTRRASPSAARAQAATSPPSSRSSRAMAAGRR